MFTSPLIENYLLRMTYKFISPKIFNKETLKKEDIKLLGDLRYDDEEQYKLNRSFGSEDLRIKYYIKGTNSDNIKKGADEKIFVNENLRNKIIMLNLNLFMDSVNKNYYIGLKTEEDIGLLDKILNKTTIHINDDETIIRERRGVDFNTYKISHIFVMILEKI